METTGIVKVIQGLALKKLTPCPPGMKRDANTRKCVERLKKRTPCPPGQRRDPKTLKCRDLVKVKLHD